MNGTVWGDLLPPPDDLPQSYLPLQKLQEAFSAPAKTTDWKALSQNVKDLITQLNMVTEQSPTHLVDSTPVTFQASLEANDADALRRRAALKQKPLIKSAIDKWWKMLPKNEYGCIEKATYFGMCREMFPIVDPSMPRDRYDEIIEKDWIFDSKGLMTMDFQTFSDAMFIFMDLWSESISDVDYGGFAQSVKKEVQNQRKNARDAMAALEKYIKPLVSDEEKARTKLDKTEAYERGEMFEKYNEVLEAKRREEARREKERRRAQMAMISDETSDRGNLEGEEKAEWKALKKDANEARKEIEAILKAQREEAERLERARQAWEEERRVAREQIETKETNERTAFSTEEDDTWVANLKAFETERARLKDLEGRAEREMAERFRKFLISEDLHRQMLLRDENVEFDRLRRRRNFEISCRDANLAREIREKRRMEFIIVRREKAFKEAKSNIQSVETKKRNVLIKGEINIRRWFQEDEGRFRQRTLNRLKRRLIRQRREEMLARRRLERMEALLAAKGTNLGPVIEAVVTEEAGQRDSMVEVEGEEREGLVAEFQHEAELIQRLQSVFVEEVGQTEEEKQSMKVDESAMESPVLSDDENSPALMPLTPPEEEIPAVPEDDELHRQWLAYKDVAGFPASPEGSPSALPARRGLESIPPPLSENLSGTFGGPIWDPTKSTSPSRKMVNGRTSLPPIPETKSRSSSDERDYPPTSGLIDNAADVQSILHRTQSLMTNPRFPKLPRKRSGSLTTLIGERSGSPTNGLKKLDSLHALMEGAKDIPSSSSTDRPPPGRPGLPRQRSKSCLLPKNQFNLPSSPLPEPGEARSPSLSSSMSFKKSVVASPVASALSPKPSFLGRSMSPSRSLSPLTSPSALQPAKKESSSPDLGASQSSSSSSKNSIERIIANRKGQGEPSTPTTDGRVMSPTRLASIRSESQFLPNGGAHASSNGGISGSKTWGEGSKKASPFAAGNNEIERMLLCGSPARSLSRAKF